jgi:hypothetical protein
MKKLINKTIPIFIIGGILGAAIVVVILIILIKLMLLI